MTGRQHAPRIPRGTPRWKPRATRAHGKREIRRAYPYGWPSGYASLQSVCDGMPIATFLHRYGGPGVASRRSMRTITALRRSAQRRDRRSS